MRTSFKLTTAYGFTTEQFGYLAAPSKAQQAHKAPQVRKERLAHKAQQAPLEHKAHKVTLVLKDR